MSGTTHKTSVSDRVKALDIEPDIRLTWLAGDAVWKEYGQATGELPRKASREKANGDGTHMVAVYPEWFVARIDKIVTEYASKLAIGDSKQRSLF